MTPEGWSIAQLQEVFEIQLGKMLNKEAATTPPTFPYLGNKEVQWGRFELADLRRMHFSEGERSKFSLRHGDLLVCEGGEVGRTALWRENIEVYFQKALHRLRPADNRAVPDYMLHFMQFAATTGRLADFTSQSSIAHLTREKLGQVEVTLPPASEQRKIAAILSCVDDAIEATQAVIDQLQVVKKAMMAALLTRGLPGRHTKFKMTEIGEVPEEWELVDLGSIGQWLSGGTPSKQDPSLWSGPVPWVSPKDMKRPRIDDAIDHVSIAALERGTQLAPIGSVLLVVRGMILAHTFPVAVTTGKVAFNQDIKALVPSRDFLAEFILFWLQLRGREILELTDVSNHGTKRLPSERLFASKIPKPPIKEQEAIVTIVQGMDARVREEGAWRDQLRLVKSALMSVLLTGEVRVTPDEDAA